MPLDLAEQSYPVLLAVLAAAAAMTWYAGSRLARLVGEISDRSGIGQAFAGMLLLGGITSLPELATAGTASAMGNPLLSINDLLGTSSINILLLAIGDIFYGKASLTGRTARPEALMQGVLGMILMAGVAVAVTTGDVLIPVLGTGVAALMLAIACVQSLRVANHFEGSERWAAIDPPEAEDTSRGEWKIGNAGLYALTALAALAILLGGATLAMTGDAVAEKTGLGTSIVGFVLVGFCTSLPELSSILAALRQGRYQLAIGDIFGTNLFNVQIIFFADLAYRGGAVLDAGGPFEAAAASLAVLMTGVFVVGMLERRDRTLWRMGYDSALAIAVFAGGLVALSSLA